jgi:hypothetical protein
MSGVERGWTSENPVTGERSIVQRLLFGALAPLAHARGYRGIYPRYADAGSMGSPEDAREGRPLTARFGDGEGPPR